MERKRLGIAKELHRQARVNFPRRHVEVKGISDLYQADLCEMIPFSKINKDYKYIMTIINCFTKFAIALPLKSKSATEVRTALSKVLAKHKMKHLQTDQGKEFFNNQVNGLLKMYNINHYYTHSDKKACIVERFNRTLKNKMWEKFSEQGNYKWLELLPRLIHEYNTKVHRTIGVRPVDVNENNERDILLRIVKQRKVLNKLPKIKVGDYVRISRVPKVFDKGYYPRWSNEVFAVHAVKHTFPTTYILKDYRNEILKGGFYEEELAKTKYKDDYLVEKVIKKKGNNILVRWLGFDKTHDSWIKKSDLIQ